jgi:hypothetical protein
MHVVDCPSLHEEWTLSLVLTKKQNFRENIYRDAKSKVSISFPSPPPVVEVFCRPEIWVFVKGTPMGAAAGLQRHKPPKTKI